MVRGDIVVNGVRVVKKVTADEDVGVAVWYTLCVDRWFVHRISYFRENAVTKLSRQFIFIEDLAIFPKPRAKVIYFRPRRHRGNLFFSQNLSTSYNHFSP